MYALHHRTFSLCHDRLHHLTCLPDTTNTIRENNGVANGHRGRSTAMCIINKHSVYNYSALLLGKWHHDYREEFNALHATHSRRSSITSTLQKYHRVEPQEMSIFHITVVTTSDVGTTMRVKLSKKVQTNV